MSRFVACVLKSGGDFSLSHVRLLRSMVRKNMSIPYRFVLLTDIWSKGVLASADIVVPLEQDWFGWWSKLELFRPDMPWKDEDDVTLYLDLDTVVLKDLRPYFEFDADMMVLERFKYPGDWATGIMAWKGTPPSLPYFKFSKDEAAGIRECKNDQRFLMRALKPKARTAGLSVGFWQHKFPRRFASYKKDIRTNGRLGRNIDVVCFHGKPRPWEVDEPWIREAHS